MMKKKRWRGKPGRAVRARLKQKVGQGSHAAVREGRVKALINK